MTLEDTLDRLGIADEPATTSNSSKSKRSKPTQATALIELGSSAEYWHTPAGDAYATLPVAKHRENWPIRGKMFRRWLAREYYMACNAPPGAQAVQDAIGVLEGRAVFEGDEHHVHNRVADHRGSIYIDLCDEDWQAVEITATGWKITDEPPVRFRRAKAMLPLPLPVTGGSLEDLRQFVNVSDEDWPLVAGWLLAALRPRGPYPVLCLHAEQGAGKSTTARALRGLVDPNTAPLRCEPKEPRDLMIAANNAWVVALDNLSRVPAWLSDALCRLATGGGFSTRTLYENDEETIFDATRPVIVNGIEELATRGDLVDRWLLISLPNISEDQRRPEADFWREYDRVKASIFGAALTAVSRAMRNLPTVRLDKLPRMADFAVWATAGEATPGAFMGAYTANRTAGNDLALEASPVARVLMQFMSIEKTWTGTPSDLLDALDRTADEKARRLKSWPTTARALSGTLKRLAPNLRAAGVLVDTSRTGRERVVFLRTSPEFCVTTVICVTKDDASGGSGDANDANDAKIPTHSKSLFSDEDESAYADFMGG